jgi:transcriptional regulator with XRE-family HTH domain
MLTQSLAERYQDADFWTGKLQLELFRLIKQHLEENNLSQNAFAKQIGVSKGYMSQVLNGNFDHKLSKLVSLALAIDKLPLINYEDVDKVIARARGEYEPMRKSYVAEPQQVVVNPTTPTDQGIHSSTPNKMIIFKDVA